VDALLLLVVLAASSALAVVAARGMLLVLFHLMNNPNAIQVHWGRVGFAGALFWFWYFSPRVVESLTR
jgi:hypothetical protein